MMTVEEFKKTKEYDTVTKYNTEVMEKSRAFYYETIMKMDRNVLPSALQLFVTAGLQISLAPMIHAGIFGAESEKEIAQVVSELHGMALKLFDGALESSIDQAIEVRRETL